MKKAIAGSFLLILLVLVVGAAGGVYYTLVKKSGEQINKESINLNKTELVNLLQNKSVKNRESKTQELVENAILYFNESMQVLNAYRLNKYGEILALVGGDNENYLEIINGDGIKLSEPIEKKYTLKGVFFSWSFPNTITKVIETNNGYVFADRRYVYLYDGNKITKKQLTNKFSNTEPKIHYDGRYIYVLMRIVNNVTLFKIDPTTLNYDTLVLYTGDYGSSNFVTVNGKTYEVFLYKPYNRPTNVYVYDLSGNLVCNLTVEGLYEGSRIYNACNKVYLIHNTISSLVIRKLTILNGSCNVETIANVSLGKNFSIGPNYDTNRMYYVTTATDLNTFEHKLLLVNLDSGNYKMFDLGKGVIDFVIGNFRWDNSKTEIVVSVGLQRNNIAGELKYTYVEDLLNGVENWNEITHAGSIHKISFDEERDLLVYDDPKYYPKSGVIALPNLELKNPVIVDITTFKPLALIDVNNDGYKDLFVVGLSEDKAAIIDGRAFFS